MLAQTSARSIRVRPANAVMLIALLLAAAAATGAPGAGLAAQTPDAARAAAPADTATVEVRLADGSVLFGRLLSETDEVVRLELLSGDAIELRRARILSITPLRGQLVEGQVWRPDPNTSRLFFAPTGRAVPGGDGYFSVYMIFMPFVAVGVSDRLTLAGGTPLFFSSESDGRLFWFAPKFQVVADERFNAAVGVLHFTFVGGLEFENFGVAYGVGTWGDADSGFTIGAGWGYSGTDVANKPAFMAGGEARVGRNVKLVTENYLFPGGDFALITAGPRFFGERLTADLGLALPLFRDASGIFMFPIVNFVYNW